MAQPIVIGTETEFGISIRNQSEFNPSLASGLVINAYSGDRARVQWSFEEESPGRDARGFGFESGGAGDYESGVVNVVLSNGARLYVDHAHPEYSSPECANARQAALYDKAGEVVMARAAEAAQMLVREDEVIGIYKNNSDGKGNSYGFHENYLVPRSIAFGDIVSAVTTFFVTRQVFTGAGKVGAENGRPEVQFQVTQRADFFEEQVGLETTLKRPIVNTRDEPHADPEKYRRLHVIVGDANLSETQTFLKLGTTALLLRALEDGALPENLELADPVEACWSVSHDVAMTARLRMADGSTATALELQRQYWEWLSKYGESETDDSEELLATWASVLDDLEADVLRTADRLDWAAKYRLLLGYQDRGVSWTDPKMRLLDLQYHDVNPQRSLYQKLVSRGAMRQLFTEDEIESAVRYAPEDTRAWFRGQCVTKYSDALVAANWDSLVFDTGEKLMRRVPMMEPLRGTKAIIGDLVAGAETAADLLAVLGDS